MNKEITISVRTIVRCTLVSVFAFLVYSNVSLRSEVNETKRKCANEIESKEYSLDSLQKVADEAMYNDSVSTAEYKRMLWNEEQGISNLPDRG